MSESGLVGFKDEQDFDRSKKKNQVNPIIQRILMLTKEGNKVD